MSRNELVGAVVQHLPVLVKDHIVSIAMVFLIGEIVRIVILYFDYILGQFGPCLLY